MEIILIANYEPDRQPSMQRFARLMEAGGRRRDTGDGTAGATAPHEGEAIWQSPRQRDNQETGDRAVRVVRPQVVVNRFPRLPALLKKWLGYVDKFVLFPKRLRALAREARASGRNCVFHICDHSNAMYVAALQAVPHVVTCHDVFAIRAARGEVPEQPTGFTGRWLQRLIAGGLRKAALIACDSEATRRELIRVVQVDSARTSVVPLHVDSSVFHPDPGGSCPSKSWRDVLRARGQIPAFDRYLLHVGGGSWYKNRDGVLRVFRELLDPHAASRRNAGASQALQEGHREQQIARETGLNRGQQIPLGHPERSRRISALGLVFNSVSARIRQAGSKVVREILRFTQNDYAAAQPLRQRSRTIPEPCSATLDPSTMGDRTAPILAPRPFGFAQGDEPFAAQPSRSSRQPDLGLVLVGPPLSAAQWNMLGEDLRSRVICLHNLDDSNLAVLYRGAEALLFPSLDEGFGWPVLEANACGCPAVISRRGSLPEVGGDAAVYIDPADEAGAVKTVDAFLRQSPVERVESRQSALQNASRFNQEVTIQAYLGLYRRAIEETRSLKR